MEERETREWEKKDVYTWIKNQKSCLVFGMIWKAQ